METPNTKPEDVKHLTDTMINDIADALIVHIDGFLLQHYIELNDGETSGFFLDHLVRRAFPTNDDRTIQYLKMTTSKEKIANKLMEKYNTVGWFTELKEMVDAGAGTVYIEFSIG